MKMLLEFKAGDIVTFEAYRAIIKSKVITAKLQERPVSNDIEPMYQLEGISHPLITFTTGRSIVESKYYKAMTQEEKDHPFRN